MLQLHFSPNLCEILMFGSEYQRVLAEFLGFGQSTQRGSSVFLDFMLQKCLFILFCHLQTANGSIEGPPHFTHSKNSNETKETFT